MTIKTKELQLALAERCMNPYDLCKAAGIQYQTCRRIISAGKCKMATIGKIAKALNMSVKDLVDLDAM